MQEKRNSIVYALELRLSCTNPLKCLNIKYMDKYLHCDGVDIGVHSFVFFRMCMWWILCQKSISFCFVILVLYHLIDML